MQSPRTGLILSSLTGPPVALYRTRSSRRPSQHCPLQDEVPFTALSIALYWTRPSAQSPETRRLALYRTRPYQHNSSKAKTFEGLKRQLTLQQLTSSATAYNLLLLFIYSILLNVSLTIVTHTLCCTLIEHKTTELKH